MYKIKIYPNLLVSIQDNDVNYIGITSLYSVTQQIKSSEKYCVTKRIYKYIEADLEIKSEDSGETPLLVAVSALFLAKLKQGFEPDVIKVIKFLINAGADVNAQGKDGNTALSLAKEIGNTEIVQLLLDAGAKDNQLGS